MRGVNIILPHSQLEELEQEYNRRQQQQQQGGGGVQGFSAMGRNSKRSRSLIRRSSKKVKQQVNNVQNPEECAIS